MLFLSKIYKHKNSFHVFLAFYAISNIFGIQKMGLGLSKIRKSLHVLLELLGGGGGGV